MAAPEPDLTDRVADLEAKVRVAHAELREKARLESALRGRIILLKDKVLDQALCIAVLSDHSERLRFEVKSANAEYSSLKAKYDELNAASYQYAEAMEVCMDRQKEIEQDLSEKCTTYTGILLSGAVSLDSDIFETLDSTKASSVRNRSPRSTDSSGSATFDSVSDRPPGTEEQHASAKTEESPVHAVDSSSSAPSLQRQKLQHHSAEELASYLQKTAIAQKACNSVSPSEQEGLRLDWALDPENTPCPMVISGGNQSKLQYFRPQNYGAVNRPSEGQASGSTGAANAHNESAESTNSTHDEWIKQEDIIENVQDGIHGSHR